MTGKSTLNRSLIRGMSILRAFKPGSGMLGNGEIAELTGLPRATVSRLTQTMVGEGFLQYDEEQRAYKLGAPVLSLAFAMRNSSRILQLAGPLMEEVAKRERINVGIALADRDEMVYLASVRLGSRTSVRTVMPGQRIPMDSTSLGRAWLSTLPVEQRASLFELFRLRHPRHWDAIKEEIDLAIASVHEVGYCAASWLPNVVALATPIVFDGGGGYALNVSVTTDEPIEEAVARLRGPLLALVERIRAAPWDSDC